MVATASARSVMAFALATLPEERGSWEENPPTMLEFAQRDVRWCQGNMQHLRIAIPCVDPLKP